MSTTIPPVIGDVPPESPAPPPRGIIGTLCSLQNFTISETSPVSSGKTMAHGFGKSKSVNFQNRVTHHTSSDWASISASSVMMRSAPTIRPSS